MFIYIEQSKISRVLFVYTICSEIYQSVIKKEKKSVEKKTAKKITILSVWHWSAFRYVFS